MELWEVKERRLLYVFLVLLLILWSGDILGAYFSGNWGLAPFSEGIIGSLNFSSFLMAIFLVGRFKDKGIHRFRYILRNIVYISLFCSFMVCLTAVFDAYNVIDIGMFEETFMPWQFAIIILILYVAFFLAFFAIITLAMLMLMGFVGVIYLVLVGLVPLALGWIKRITARGHFKARAFAWLMLVPEHLDTGTLSVLDPKCEDTFPWRRFWNAMAWMLSFNILVAVEISLNPFLLRLATLEELFSVLTSGFVVVPMVVIPWLITDRLDARIEGPVKDFKVYEGIRSRLLRTFLALGTLIIFIRFAFEDLNMERVLFNLAVYGVFSFVLLFAIGYIYFNFFEYELARRIAERLPWMHGGDDEAPVTEGTNGP